MPIIWANSDSQMVYPLAISKAAGKTLTFQFQTNGSPANIGSDTWEFIVYNPDGTANSTLTSGAGLTVTTSAVVAVLSATTLSAASPGGFSYALIDESGRTRLTGSFVLTA
jgi:hypothetical protein